MMIIITLTLLSSSETRGLTEEEEQGPADWWPDASTEYLNIFEC